MRNEPVQAGDALLASLTTMLNPRSRQEMLTEAVDAFFQGRAWEKMKTACKELLVARLSQGPGWRYDAEMRLSIACRGLRQYDEALEALKKATELVQQWGRKEDIIKVRGQTALVLLDNGDFAECARLSKELWDEGVRHPLSVITLVRALIGIGDLDRAQAICEEFEHSNDDQVTLAYLRAYLADAGRGDRQTAWYGLGVAAGSDRRVQAEALTHLIEISPSGSEDRFEQTRHRLRTIDYARSLVDDVFSDASWQAALDEAQKFPHWLDDFVEEALVGQYDREAIYEIERFRTQAFVNILSERSALWSARSTKQGWLKIKTTIDAQRARYHLEALSAHNANWHERRRFARKVESLRARAFSAEGIILIAPPGQGLSFPQSLVELLGDYQLASGECLLTAYALLDRAAVWALDSHGATHRIVLPGLGRTVVERMVAKLRAIGYDDSLPNIRPLLDELDEAWGVPLATWLSELRVRRGFLCVGTALAALPLDCTAALLKPGAPELALLPSASTLGFVRGVRTPLPEMYWLVPDKDISRVARDRMEKVRGRALLVVDPTRDLDFAPLEAAIVADALQNKNLTVLDRNELEATELARACGQTEITHIIGHGRFDDASPYRSGIRVDHKDKDALWTNADIFSDVEAPASRLVVLSGCETGQTHPNLLSEEVSLPASFIAAGYAAVIASRWAVDDLSTTLLMYEFYRRWCVGDTSITAALAKAQQWLRILSREEAKQLLDDLGEKASMALPSRAHDCRRVCQDAQQLLDAESEYPFSDPIYWSAFFISGDGAITAEGPDARVPSETMDESD
jgi:hypothetical protein